MFKKEGSETFIITFIFLAIGFLIKDLTSFEASIAKIVFYVICYNIALFLPFILSNRVIIPEHLMLLESLVFAFLSAFYVFNHFVLFKIAFILFVISIFVFIFLESSYFSKYKMIKNFEKNL